MTYNMGALGYPEKKCNAVRRLVKEIGKVETRLLAGISNGQLDPFPDEIFYRSLRLVLDGPVTVSTTGKAGRSRRPV